MNIVPPNRPEEPRSFRVSGVVHYANGLPASGIRIAAIDCDLRHKQPLGEAQTDRNGAYTIEYSEERFLNQERGTADLVVRAIGADGSILIASPVMFNAPQSAVIDLSIPLEQLAPPSLFERIGSTLEPLLGRVSIEELEENQEHQDLTFLLGETGFEKSVLARFVLAHCLARRGIDREFWFALLGGSIFEYADDESLKDQLITVSEGLPAIDDRAVRNALVSSFNQQELPATLQTLTEKWIEAFLNLSALIALGADKSPTFVKMALDHAGIVGAEKQAKFARLFNQHGRLTPELLTTLEKDESFNVTEIADLRTSYQLADLTQGDFSVVKSLKEKFDIRQPEQIRTLAKQSEQQWVELIGSLQDAGSLSFLPALNEPTEAMPKQEAEMFGKTLERQFREAFPTASFAGGMERALAKGGAKGIRNAESLGKIIDLHPDFDLLRTPIDEFLKKNLHPDIREFANDPKFPAEIKAVQRVFKLAPTFEATDSLLADGIHSAQMVYRLGQSEFVKSYGVRAGFTAESARQAWNQAANTHAAVLTVVADLKALGPDAMPLVLQNSGDALKNFPNWENLFQSGDICSCEQCRSVLGPAAYFTDLLMFLRDRKSAKSSDAVKDILFNRRPDLGYLELNCDNALTTLPYVDVVCEVLENAIAGDVNDVELSLLDTIPTVSTIANDEVKEALSFAGISVGADFTLSQVDPNDPNRWVVHGDDATYLLLKKTSANFFARLLPNTKASSAELRAFPAYVNPSAYKKLREAKFPLAIPRDLFPDSECRGREQRTRSFSLPFDLFGEEVRASFQKCKLQRWDLMRTMGGSVAPNNPTESDIAAEYFGISSDPDALFDERWLIFQKDPLIQWDEPTVQEVWSETGNNGWLNTLANVSTFLLKSGLEYEELLALLDLPFINPDKSISNSEKSISIFEPFDSCDADLKLLVGLNIANLDRIHRFLRLWRKLNGWKMWELDMALRCPGIGHKNAQAEWFLDETVLVNLYYLDRLRIRLGAKTTVEQLCGLFNDLNTKSHFTKTHEKLADGLYQSLFLNKKLIQPLDSALEIDSVTHDIKLTIDPDTGSQILSKISDHYSIVQAALGVREADLIILKTLIIASNPTPHSTDDLTLANLSLLWRHSWLAKILKLKVDEWKTVLKLLQQDILCFNDPQTAWKFVERVDQLKASGFSLDELNWLLTADLSSKVAMKVPDVTRFLTTLWTELQAISTEYDPAHYQFLNPPSDVENLAALLTSLLSKLKRNEAEADFFLKTLQGSELTEANVEGLPWGFIFPSEITGAPNKIPISCDWELRFSGRMTANQRDKLLTDTTLVLVKNLESYKKAIEILYQQSGTVIVTGLPEGFNFPDAITVGPDSIPISYVPVLRFTWLMTPEQRTILLEHTSLANVTIIPFYQKAIEDLFRTPRLSLKFLDLEFTTPLSNLPAEVDFQALSNPSLIEKISYDPDKQTLCFVGILSSHEADELKTLSNNPDYQSAVTSLFLQPGDSVFPPEKVWLQNADLNFPFRNPNNLTNDNLKDNLATAVKKALGFLAKKLSNDLVIQRMSLQLGLAEELTLHLLDDFAIISPILPGQPHTSLLRNLTGESTSTIDVVDFVTQKANIQGWFWANRAAAIMKKWKITLSELAELEKINTMTSSPRNLDFGMLPLNSSDSPAIALLGCFLNTAQFLKFRETLPETDITLFEVLVKLCDNTYLAADFAEDVHMLNDTWSQTEVEALLTSWNPTNFQCFLLAENWERLRRAFYFTERLNAGISATQSFAAPAMKETHVNTLKRLLRAKFEDTWLTLCEEIQNALRARKRDSLATYLLTQPKSLTDVPTGKWENTNDLYAYYLLDVEMSACQLTSRLVQASGSVQLFVQRCFMGLEPDVTVEADGTDGDSAWRWWKWMRKYRVWEANRKVYLWPENWIEPELKKDRSSFFRDMENELMQHDINQDTVEKAYSNYLEKLDSVAQLQIAGFYQEDDGDNSIVHVFGRSPGAEPHIYYYRRYDYRQWTPWEKVDLDIQGDYLIPAVVNKQLFLFWPVFTEVPDVESNCLVTIPKGGEENAPVEKAKKKLRLQMAISDYRQGKWTPKRVSKQYAESSDSHTAETLRRHYTFIPFDRSNTDGQFGIAFSGCSSYDKNTGSGKEKLVAVLKGAFSVSGCKGVPELMKYHGTFRPAIVPESAVTRGKTYFHKWEEQDDRTDLPNNDLAFVRSSINDPKDQTPTEVLRQTPGLFSISPPWQMSFIDMLMDDGLFAISIPPEIRRILLCKDVPQLPPRSKRANDHIAAIGTWLPFFYSDKKRTFFVLPSEPVNSKDQKADDVRIVQSYYPDIKREFGSRDFHTEQHLRNWAHSIELPSPKDRNRQLLEEFLYNQIRYENTPPFDDDEIRELLIRFFRRFTRYQLGSLSLRRFQFCQYHFWNFYHPFACDFSKLIYNPLQGIPGLMKRETQLKNSGFNFKRVYQPTNAVVDPSQMNQYPQEIVDFSPGGAYSSYNWEMFFHAPLLIANSLSRNQRFEEAREWYHFMFNPIGVESTSTGGAATSKYWITKPFFETTDPLYVQQRIENLMGMLSTEKSGLGQPLTELEKQVLDWRTNPFEPHRIANYRTVAYQKTVVMKYLDNLIEWGDYLFRQDSMESINEATQIYVLAAELLGPRPKIIAPKNKPPVESFNELENQLDRFSNAIIEVENLIPPSVGTSTNGDDSGPLPMLYFCIPKNDKMLGYWDTVADRLYKIRHCMNIEGVVRQLALFAPPIDPGALVKAVAGGVDIGAALADLNAPLPVYKFNTILQKANELCNDVKALGTALLSALEKKDSETLSLLRQGQEMRALEAVKTVKEKQIDEAKENLEGLRRSKAVTELRRNYYRDIPKLTLEEQLHLTKLSESHSLQEAAQGVKLAASIISLLPAIDLGVSGFGGSPIAKAKLGGLELGQAAGLAAEVLSYKSAMASNESAMASSVGSFKRRWDDWKLQERLADKELEQVDKSIASAELRLVISEKELENHLTQIENAKAIDEYMRSKYTNEELYQWQVGQISGVYFQSYKLAYDLAKRAERCFRFEIGLQESSFISFGYWDSLKKGLLSGEKLQYDLRRLESAYLEQNLREFELTKHLSLMRLDPLALVELKATGRCFFRIPEEVFDLDYPGHYFRRIKSVSLTLPCVTGPYTTISCSLRLIKNSVRINTVVDDNGYPHNSDSGLPVDDSRFVQNNLPVKAIATSSGQNDSGLFELNFRDERYLPFEGAGAISEWSLELFNDIGTDFGRPLRQFDYDTIADAVVHLKYTAREDVGAFKNSAITNLRAYLSQGGASSSLLMLDLRRDFPSQWSRFLNPANPDNGHKFELEMSSSLFPIRDAGKTLMINSLYVWAKRPDTGPYTVVMTTPLPEPDSTSPTSSTITLNTIEQYGGLYFGQKNIPDNPIKIEPVDPPVTWQIEDRSGEKLPQDVVLVLGYHWSE